MTETSYHYVTVHWEPAARDDLRWYQWAYWIGRVLLKECYQDRHARIGGIALAGVALFVYWHPAAAWVVARAGSRFLLIGLCAVLVYTSFDAFRSAFWLPDKGARFAARLAAFTSGTSSAALSIACATTGLMAR